MSELQSSNESAQENSNVADFSQVFFIQIDIKKASDLIKADTFGKSDPYCVVGAFGKNYVTKTIKKTLEPVWNEKTQFCFFNDPKELHFQVFDWDGGTKDDAIGDVKLPLNGFWDKEHKGFDGKLKLQNVKKGEIYVSVKGRKLLPIKLEDEVKRLNELNEVQIKQMSEQSDNISTLTQENEKLTSENENKRIQIDQLTSIKESLEDSRNDLSEEQKTLENEIETLENEKKELETKLNELRTKEQNTQASLDKVNDEIDDLNDENTKLEKEITEINNSIKTKESEYERLQEKLREEQNKPKEEAKDESPQKEPPTSITNEEPEKPMLTPTDSNTENNKPKDGGDEATQCCKCVIL